MTVDIDVIRQYFSKLGLEPEIADMYLALHTYGPQHISQLSRTSNVERTRIYRLLDSVRGSSLFEIEIHQKREVFKAAPATNLQILLSKKEEELREMRAELEHINLVLNQDSLISPLTRVQFYRGTEGVKQMYWNETRARSEVLCILYENMQVRTGRAFFNRWVRKSNELGIRHRGIIGDNFMRSQEEWYGTHRNERLEHWEQRQISHDVFPIAHSTVMYDDVVAYCNWNDGEVFGVEIYDQEIASAQRHFFEMLWQQAAPAGDVDVPKGLAALEAPLLQKRDT